MGNGEDGVWVMVRMRWSNGEDEVWVTYMVRMGCG